MSAPLTGGCECSWCLLAARAAESDALRERLARLRPVVRAAVLLETYEIGAAVRDMDQIDRAWAEGEDAR